MAPQPSLSSVSAALATMQPKQEKVAMPVPPALGTAFNTGVLGKMVAASAAEPARKIQLYSRFVSTW